MKISKSVRTIITGEPIVSGLVLGKVARFGTRVMEFQQYWINQDQVDSETERFHHAIKVCHQQLERIKSKLCQIQGREYITILDSHILFLQDELLVKSILHAIKTSFINAEWALHQTIQEIREAFGKMGQPYFREREYDIAYIENVLLSQLMGKSQNYFKKVPKGAIVLAYNLSPAETLHLIRFKIAGLITEVGGINSHTAIVARSLEIPFMICADPVLKHVADGESVIMDADAGKIIIHPQAREEEQLSQKRQKFLQAQKAMKKEAHLDAVSKDGVSYQVLGNMELTDELDGIEDSGCNGIGLYRTEYLFLDRETLPNEDEQEKAYRRVLRRLYPKEVTIRTIDLGADKIAPNQCYKDQANPAMGLRAIRYSLKDKEGFMAQIRALLRASTAGNLKICFPMISTVDEFRKVKRIVAEARANLQKEGVQVSESVPLGVMIETPAAVVEIDLLAEEADFFSVGTNDLIQYMLAVDRTNDLVSYLYSPLHPSVLRTLQQICETAKQFTKEVTLCGEMAADPAYLLVTMGLGFNRLSMNGASIPRIKKMIRETTHAKAETLVGRLLGLTSMKEMKKVLHLQMKDSFSEYFQ